MTGTWTHDKQNLFPKVSRPGAVQTGLCVTANLGVELVLRTGEDEQVVGETDLEAWGVTAIEAASHAVENLRAVADEGTDWMELPSAPFIYALFAEDGDAASRMLVLDELLDVPISGVLVAVPTQGQLVILPLTHYEVLEDLPTMVIGAQLAARASSTPLSTQLFFFDGAEWTTLEVDDEPGETKVHPSPGLARALETLASQSLAPLVAEA